MAVTARIDELRRKFEENPRRYFAHLANEYRKLGDLDSAIAICRRELAQHPEHVSGHIVLGQALYEAGRRSEARGVFEAALRLDPENLIALRHLGDIARADGDDDAARRWYGRILEADPRNDDVAALLAGVAGGRPTERVGEERYAPPAAPPAAAATPAPPEPPALGRSSFADLLGDAERRQETAAPADEGFVGGWELPTLDAAAPVEPAAAPPVPPSPSAGPRIPIVTGPVATTPASGLPALDPLEAELLGAGDTGGEALSSSARAGGAPEAAPATPAGPEEGFVDELFFDELTPGGEAAPATGTSGAAATPTTDEAAAEEPVADEFIAEGLAVDELSIAPPEPEPDEPAAETADWMDSAPVLPELGDEPPAPVVGLDAAPAEDSAQAQLGAAELGGAELPAAELWAEELAAAEPVLDQAMSATSAVEDPEAPAWGEPSEFFAAAEPEALGARERGEAAEPARPADEAHRPFPEGEGPDDDVVDVLDLGGELIEAAPPPARDEPTLRAAPPAPAAPVHDDAHVDAQELSALASGAFATETLAELFVQQGHLDQAVAVYERLAAERPDEPALARRLEEVRRMADGEPSEAAGEQGAGAEAGAAAGDRAGAEAGGGAGAEPVAERPTEALAESGAKPGSEPEAEPVAEQATEDRAPSAVEPSSQAPGASPSPATTAGDFFAALAARPVSFSSSRPPEPAASAPAVESRAATPARAATPVKGSPAVQVAPPPAEPAVREEDREPEVPALAAAGPVTEQTGAPEAVSPEPLSSEVAAPERVAEESTATEQPETEPALLSGDADETDDRAAHLLASAYAPGEPATGSLVDDLAALPTPAPAPSATAAGPRAGEPSGDDLSFDRFFAGFEDLLSAPTAAGAGEPEPIAAAEEAPEAAGHPAGDHAPESPVAAEREQPNESSDEDLAQFNAWLKGLGDL